MAVAATITPSEVSEISNGISNYGGTLVQLPPAVSTMNNAAPPPPTSSFSAAQATNIDDKIERRKARMEERKLELLMEARKARVQWIRDGEKNSSTDGGCTSIGSIIQLNELQACRPDILPCAPQIIKSMLTSNCDWRKYHERSKNDDTLNRMLLEILEKQGLSSENVSKHSTAVATENEERGEKYSAKGRSTFLVKLDLDLPPIPHPAVYDSFLDALCNPSAADIVISIQKFCSTIHEAANVMVNSMKGENNGGAVVKPTDISLLNGESSSSSINVVVSSSSDDETRELHNYGASLAKAVRGFLNKTMREINEHEAFENVGQSKEENNPSCTVSSTNNSQNLMDDRVDLQASLERFVYGKCRRYIDMVISQSPEKVMIKSADIKRTSVQTFGEMDDELHEKMLSLQFVSAAHLEIRCLKSRTADVHEDIHLSYAIEQLQSIQQLSSPRQMLHSILLAYRGVSYALNEVCGQDGDPPGADNILPTLILATLRAHVLHLPSSLHIIETFAPLPLLRGETGYAYTNLCGAMQFIKDLDVAGHLAEVAVLGGAGENSALLSIGPEEFRIGLEECRKQMALKAENEKQISLNNSVDEIVANNDMIIYDDCTNDEKYPRMNITARHVRIAREQGEAVDLDWALEEQQICMWQQGQIADMPLKPEGATIENATLAGLKHLKHSLPPEEPSLPSQFTRTYSFLTARPDNISLYDLPQLLKEYKMLVHTTEALLNERSIWRENERKRLLKLEREHLERDLADSMGADVNNN